MIDQVLLWLGATDKALLGQGPAITIVLTLLGGYAVGQAIKFPVKASCALPEAWENWLIRCGSMCASFAIGLWLGGLPPAVFLVTALCQPLAYRVVIRLIRRFAPWLAATPVGSASPTEDDEYALTQWRNPDSKP